MLKNIIGLVVVTSAIIGGSYLVRAEPEAASTPTPAVLQSTGTADRGELERLIRAYETRVADNPTALQYTFLGRLYLQRGTLTGDLASYARAEEVLREALELYPTDSESRTLLATARYTMHDFVGAIAIAEDAAGLGARAVVGDASLELGRYDTAATIYDELARALPGVAAVDARRSRLAFLRGDIDSARTFAERAARAARREGAFGAALGRYHVALSTLAFERGDYDAAATEARAALAVADGWYAGLTALARARAAQERTDEAIELYRQSLEAVPEPATAAALGDLLELSGDAAGAAEQRGTIDVIARLGGIFDRQLALYEADHGIDDPALVELAAADLAARPDVYGHDALAWALLAAGQPARARIESDRALALGTRDARLLYHAGMISAALGEDDRARDELRAALDLSPRFDPLQARRAEATLRALS